jgi:hypothetical protein
MRPLSLLAFILATAATARTETYRERLLADEPVAYWRFDDILECCTPNETHETLRANAGANVSLLEPGPRPPAFPLFPPENTAADFTQFARDTFLRVQDPGPLSVFDFTTGHTLTVEAWVRPLKVTAGQEAIIVTKGHTGNDGVPANNQNWAMTLRGQSAETLLAADPKPEPTPPDEAHKSTVPQPTPAKPDEAKLKPEPPKTPGAKAVLATISLVFRDEKNAGPASWHRFTSTRGFLPGKDWHHVAISYTFGDPATAQLWIDGNLIPGAWDLGGPTTLAPVVDNDELWIGGALAGRPESQFPGQIDELAIYRTALKPERMKLHALREGAAPALHAVAAPAK